MKCKERNNQETCINPHEYCYRGCTDKCQYYADAELSLPPADATAEEILQKYMDASMIICPLHVVPRTVALSAMHEFAAQRQPTADGAKANFRVVLDEIQRWIEWELEPTISDFKALWNQLSDAITISEQPQPTAEGAEDITQEVDDFIQSKGIWNHSYISDRNNIVSYEVAELIAEFAALTADKMVSERLKELVTELENELKPEFMNTVFTWAQIKNALITLKAERNENTETTGSRKID